MRQHTTIMMNGGLAAAAACVGVVIGAESESGPEKICFVYDTQSLLATQFDDDDDGRRVDAILEMARERRALEPCDKGTYDIHTYVITQGVRSCQGEQQQGKVESDTGIVIVGRRRRRLTNRPNDMGDGCKKQRVARTFVCCC